MGMDCVFDCLPRPVVAGVRDREARSGSSSDRFLDFMDRWGFPGPGDVEVVLFGRGAVGLLALDAELPMFLSRWSRCKLVLLLLFVCTLNNRLFFLLLIPTTLPMRSAGDTRHRRRTIIVVTSALELPNFRV